MWYNFDVHRFGKQMLPPILRSKVMLAFIQVFLAPLEFVMVRFSRLRVDSQSKLGRSGLVATLVDVLSQRFALSDGDVWLEDIASKDVHLYYQQEMQRTIELYRYTSEQAGLPVCYFDEGSVEHNFVLHIPSFLQEEDTEVRRIINYYCPAGRRYIINYYDYNG